MGGKEHWLGREDLERDVGNGAEGERVHRGWREGKIQTQLEVGLKRYYLPRPIPSPPTPPSSSPPSQLRLK